jgi:hypothetical protein
LPPSSVHFDRYILFGYLALPAGAFSDWSQALTKALSAKMEIVPLLLAERFFDMRILEFSPGAKPSMLLSICRLRGG